MLQRSFRLPYLARSPTTSQSIRVMTTVPALAKNFPDSTAVPSSYFKWPGITADSTKTVRRILEENDRKYDIYGKLRFAHNHFPHSALTRYVFGAPSKLLEDAWVHDEQDLAPLDPEMDDRKTGDLSRLPEKITRDNWDDPKTLGFKDAYSRYIVFFHEEIERLGPLGAVEEYVFSPQANWATREDRPAPQMLVRMVAGVLHPFIHTGFGLEFKDVVVLAEGLAELAIHDHGIMRQLFPSSWPEEELKPQSTSVPKVKPDTWGSPTLPEGSLHGPSLLEVYAEFLSDTEISPPPYDPDMMINDRLESAVHGDHGDKVVALVQKWSLTDQELADGPGGWERKLEELGVLVTLLACASQRDGHAPKVDFFLMHALTSSIFLPAYMTSLDPAKRRALLRTYLLGVLATVIARGKPKPNLEYLMNSPLISVPPGSTPKAGSGPEALSEPSDVKTRNPWMSIVESSLYGTDSHTPKAIRPLAYYASSCGSAPPGGLIGAMKDGQEVIPGLSKVDGTIFVRSAGIIMAVMGWTREGERAGGWTHDPVGYDEVWK